MSWCVLTHPLPSNEGFFRLYFTGTTVSELTRVYSEYLERMFENSDDLAVVDLFSVPQHVDLENPVLTEWADLA